MYVREEDVFNAIYCQLKLYIDKHFISTPQYRQQIRQFNEQIEQATQHNYEANENFRLCYEGLVKGEKSIEDLWSARDIANQTNADLDGLMASKADYEKQYQVFHKLLRVSNKEPPFSEVIEYIEKITVDQGRRIVVEWGRKK